MYGISFSFNSIRNEELDIRKPYVTRVVPASVKNKHSLQSLVNRTSIKLSDECRRNRKKKSQKKFRDARDPYYKSKFEESNGDSYISRKP